MSRLFKNPQQAAPKPPFTFSSSFFSSLTQNPNSAQMEESSERRRDRLNAIRTEASNQPQSQPQSSPSSSSNLSNPLMNASSFFNETTSPISRFDFYTDPMAAFSGSKRANPDTSPSPIRGASPHSHPSNQTRAVPRNYNFSATHQFQTSPSPSHSPWRRSPIQFQTSYQFQTNPSPNQSPWRSPIQLQTPPNPNPSYWSRSGGSSSHLGPRPGRSGGARAHGSHHDRGFNRRESSHYYMKTMVKDPWRKLKPTVGSILVPRFGSRSWLPDSIAASKRAKVVQSGGAADAE